MSCPFTFVIYHTDLLRVIIKAGSKGRESGPKKPGVNLVNQITLNLHLSG